jgi:hypothetical protein
MIDEGIVGKGERRGDVWAAGAPGFPPGDPAGRAAAWPGLRLVREGRPSETDHRYRLTRNVYVGGDDRAIAEPLSASDEVIATSRHAIAWDSGRKKSPRGQRRPAHRAREAAGRAEEIAIDDVAFAEPKG